MSKFKFEKYDDPFRAFNIQMSIICDLEQGGKIDVVQTIQALL